MGLILLDLDGTLVADALWEDEGKLQRRQYDLFTEPVLLPNRWDRLNQCARDGDRFAIVTNQGGVAWGYHTQAEVYQRIGATLRQLEFFWGRPFSVHVAFKHPRATLPQFKGDDGRKPAPAMLEAALTVHDVDLTSSRAEPGPEGSVDFYPAALMVGDRAEDEEAANSANVTYMAAGAFFGA